jgi:hypothetical protein
MTPAPNQLNRLHAVTTALTREPLEEVVRRARARA